MSNDDKLASAVSLFKKLTTHKKKTEILIETQKLLQYTGKIVRLTGTQQKLKSEDKDIENYHLFFLVEFILFINFTVEKLDIIKNVTEQKSRLFLLLNYSYTNKNNNIIPPFVIDLIPKIKQFNTKEHEQMIQSFIKLNENQQEDILLLAEFILNNKEDDPLWREYENLIEEVKTFLSRSNS
ncbi:hypothetical protein ACN4EE_04125 [Geminocystis sp. CENA526]|uniref:hypothetical protein n=1 Tax=Geminocystis sp. CENA526 TaxID=1355871 RepID=UPI003D6E5742